MKICNLTQNSRIYTSNVYLITGSWNTLGDINTLVDVGRDPVIFERLPQASTGVGKRQVETVVITHNHYDHTSMLERIKAVFNPRVYAYSRSIKGVDRLLKDGDVIKLGDRKFEVIHIAGHSSDSICLYNQEEGALFPGDAPLVVRSAEASFEEQYVRGMEKLCRRDVKTIYSGHGPPLQEGCNDLLRDSLKVIRHSSVNHRPE